MKKFFITSGIILGTTLFFGALFVYGIFDFSDGNAELIQTVNPNQEIQVHNKLVSQVHDIGNSIQDTAKVASVRDNLNSTIQRIDNKKIKTTYSETYLPTLENYLNSPEENLQAFLEAHNDFVEVLNKTRNY